MKSCESGRICVAWCVPAHAFTITSAFAGRLRLFALVCGALLAAGLAGATAAHAAGRVAMVMVAEDYQKLQKSMVGAKRAGDIAEALKARGVDVTLSANPSNSSARANLRHFASKAAGDDVAIVVLLGHGTTA